MLEYDCIESSRSKGPYMKNEKNKKRNSQKVCDRHPVVEEGRLAERERRLKDLEQLTLLSDVFMKKKNIYGRPDSRIWTALILFM